jgi:hemerythrin superfamily protein
MKATALLEQDHDEVESLFERFEEAEGDEKLALARQIFTELDLHTRIEEEIFYPAIRSEVPDTEDDVREGIEEHHVAKQLIEELRGMSPSDEQYDAKMTVLKENVLHHVEEEEGEMFPTVEQALGAERLTALGEEMLRAKGVDPATASAGASGDDLVDLTRDELYEKAQELDITGRSDMNKDQLIEAIRSNGG